MVEYFNLDKMAVSKRDNGYLTLIFNPYKENKDAVYREYMFNVYCKRYGLDYNETLTDFESNFPDKNVSLFLEYPSAGDCEENGLEAYDYSKVKASYVLECCNIIDGYSSTTDSISYPISRELAKSILENYYKKTKNKKA